MPIVTTLPTISERLKQARKDSPESPFYWRSGYTRLYGLEDYEQIKKHLSEQIPQATENKLGEDTNTRIFLLEKIVTNVFDILTTEEQDELKRLVESQLSDDRMCDIGYSFSYGDDEDTTTVGSAARYALQRIEEIKK